LVAVAAPSSLLLPGTRMSGGSLVAHTRPGPGPAPAADPREAPTGEALRPSPRPLRGPRCRQQIRERRGQRGYLEEGAAPRRHRRRLGIQRGGKGAHRVPFPRRHPIHRATARRRGASDECHGGGSGDARAQGSSRHRAVGGGTSRRVQAQFSGREVGRRGQATTEGRRACDGEVLQGSDEATSSSSSRATTPTTEESSNEGRSIMEEALWHCQRKQLDNRELVASQYLLAWTTSNQRGKPGHTICYTFRGSNIVLPWTILLKRWCAEAQSSKSI